MERSFRNDKSGEGKKVKNGKKVGRRWKLNVEKKKAMAPLLEHEPLPWTSVLWRSQHRC